MKKLIYSFTAILLMMLVASCEKNEETELVNPDFKNIEIFSGQDLEIPVLVSEWKIESIKDLISGDIMLDKQLHPISLETNGTVEASNNWLTLERTNNDSFTICLKENFSSVSRGFIVCINENGNKDYVTVIQSKGRYKLLESEVCEIDNSREIYTTDEGCQRLTLTNVTNKPVWEPTNYIFEDIVYSSQFESDDWGAFDWMADEDMEVSMPRLIIDNSIYWGNSCVYKRGVTTKPFVTNIPGGDKIQVLPNQTFYVHGEITYCKRVCDYVFTIENEISGTHFNIHGVWTQIVPICSRTILSDK